MKKFIFVALTLILSTSILSPLTTFAEVQKSYEVSSNTLTRNAEENREIEKFSAMQDKITAVLTIENGKYVYDKREVKAIINKFDFEELAKKTDIVFSTESFFKDAIENIENTTFDNQIQSRNANQYNRNYYEEGWNYARCWWDEDNTNRKIIEFEDVGQYAELAGAAGGLLGAFAGAVITGPVGAIIAGGIGFGVFYEGWYFSNVALNLNRIKNGTGTVYEMNKFTTIYSLWTQDKYK